MSSRSAPTSEPSFGVGGGEHRSQINLAGEYRYVSDRALEVVTGAQVTPPADHDCGGAVGVGAGVAGGTLRTRQQCAVAVLVVAIVERHRIRAPRDGLPSRRDDRTCLLVLQRVTQRGAVDGGQQSAAGPVVDFHAPLEIAGVALRDDVLAGGA